MSTTAEREAGVPIEERKRDDAAIAAALAAFANSGRVALGREADPSRAKEELTAAYEELLARHPGTSPADVTRVRQIIALAREWSATLASSHRNFEEFLAKTREIVTATCVGVGQTRIRIDAKAYDWVIVDEAARCTPGELAVPIQVGRRVLLVGDHLQLMPMIERPLLKALAEDMPDAPPADLARSDFERAYTSSFGEANGQILTEQYRMAPAICDLVSEVFYEPHRVTLATSAERSPDPLFAKPLPGALATPITWVDTSYDQRHVEQEAPWNRHSFWNQAEVDAVLKILEHIAQQEDLVAGLAAGSAETPIGVICMYSAQKAMIEQAFGRRAWDARFRRLVRTDTVDSYQGKENSIVVVSLVRCNERRDAGHVRQSNRCNVALSRAKERLFIVGSRRMWTDQPRDAPMRRVVKHLEGAPATTAFLRSETV